jgi:hypothetical protein
MDYSKVAARLDYIAKGMSWLLTGSEFAQGSQSRAMPEHREQTPEENDDKQLN